MNIDFYKPLLEFLSLYLGSDSEILLCDTEKILLVFNPLEAATRPGADLPAIHKAFLEDSQVKELPYTINYRAMTSSQEKLRSATMFLREEGLLTGFLTINSKVTALLHMREVINTLINGDVMHPDVPEESPPIGKKPVKKRTEYYESLTLSISEVIDSVIEDVCKRFGASPKRFTVDEKLQTMRLLDSRGVFLVKGSISEVATKMQLSEATVYRYLHQINK